MKHLGSLESTQEARVARGFRALQTSCVLHILMNAQLMYEPIVKQWPKRRATCQQLIGIIKRT